MIVSDEYKQRARLGAATGFPADQLAVQFFEELCNSTDVEKRAMKAIGMTNAIASLCLVDDSQRAYFERLKATFRGCAVRARFQPTA